MSMGTDKTVLKIAHRTPSSTSRRSFRLPDDLVEHAVRRLGGIAMIVGGLLLAGIAAHVFWFYAYGNLTIPITYNLMVPRIMLIAASAAMVWVARNEDLSLKLRSDLGLAYEVVATAAFGNFEVETLYAMDLPMGSTSMVVIWILLIRLMVPMKTARAALASGLSAATLPMVLYQCASTGYPPVGPMVYAGLMKTTFGAAVLAVLASRSVYHLGTAVAEARELGSYRLEERLGGGGMGDLWRASHRLLQRPAAIKLIRPEALGPAGESHYRATLQRFEREARATAMLQSVHTVDIYDFGRTGDGSFYYVMELLEGMDLELLVKRFGPLPPERVVFFLDQMCHSLSEAHEAGMVHRDVKPANIFVCRLGPDHDFIKVLDFGLVKATAEPEAMGLTAQDTAPGTPAFMAPEVVMGSAEVGPRTDLYMLGCVAYWMLTGELVFEGKTAAALMTQHVSTAPAPPSARSELQVPAALEGIVMACLEKDPADRPRSAGEIRRQLAECPLDQPWTQERAARFWRTHRPTG